MRVVWKRGSEMKGEEGEMKQRQEFLVNMCQAQLLSQCLPAILQALTVGTAVRRVSWEACRDGRQIICKCGSGIELLEVVRG